MTIFFRHPGNAVHDANEAWVIAYSYRARIDMLNRDVVLQPKAAARDRSGLVTPHLRALLTSVKLKLLVRIGLGGEQDSKLQQALGAWRVRLDWYRSERLRRPYGV